MMPITKLHPTILKPVSDVLAFDGLGVYFAEVSPADAARLIDPDKENRNQQNRNLNKQSLKRLRKAMKNRRFLLTHQTIAFDSLGSLIDGQHRLHAVIGSDIPVRLLVVEGLDPITRLVTDKGSARELKADLKICGAENPAIVSMVLSGIRRLAFNDSERLDYVDSEEDRKRYSEGIAWVVKTLAPLPRSLFTAAHIASAFAFAYPRCSAILDEAHTDLLIGAIANPEDAILSLRNQLLHEKFRISSDEQRRSYFFKTLNALFHRLNGLGTKQLKESRSILPFFRSAYGL